MDWFPLYNSIRIAAVSTALVFFLGIFAAHFVAKAPRLVKGALVVYIALWLLRDSYIPPAAVKGSKLLHLFSTVNPLSFFL